MESWFSFDDKLRSGSSFRSSRLSSSSIIASSLSSTNSSSSAMSHLSFLEQSRRLDLQAASLRESSRLAGTRRDLEFTSRKLELAAKFKTLMRNTGERQFDDNLNSSDNSNFPHGEFDELKKNYRAVQEENFKLQAVITDVTEVNKRWQKYNNDRQMYVQRLLSTIQDQQEQMNKIAEDRIFQTKELCDATSDNKSTVETLTLENVRLQEEVMLLRRRLESLEKEHKEHVEVLEFQLKAHRDDWEAERSEKQQALQDKETADKKLRDLQKDLRNLKHKYREEKQLSSGHCRCCASQGAQCNVFMPGSQVHVGHKPHCKTYRTSVHLPCPSGNLLPRGTTIFFGDDLTVDGDAKVTELPEESAEVKQIEEDDAAAERLSEKVEKDMERRASESDGNNNSEENLPDTVNSAESFEVLGVESSEVSSYGLNLEQEDSSSAGSAEHESDGEEMAASGVTIGFDHSGLASVKTFAHPPVARSPSFPTPERKARNISSGGVNLLVSRWSFDSHLSNLSIASPPVSQTFAASVDSVMKGARSKDLGPSSSSASGPVQRKPPSWKTSYYEEGAPTQTEDDVICPGCGQIFPPKMHIKFLDHFEKCQNNESDHKRSRSRN